MRARTLPAFAAAIILLAALLALASCSTGGTQQAGGRHKLDLKIGDLVPLSGTEQPFGAPGQKAVNLALGQIRRAIDEANADHTVTVTHENYRSDPKLAQDLAGKLQRAGNSCLVGPWSNGAVIPVASVITVPQKVVTITPAAGTPALTRLEIGGYLTSTVAPDGLQGDALATTIADALGGAKGKKVSIGAVKNLYGQALTTNFSNAWEKLGGKISARVLYESNLPGYKKQASELVASKPDAFAFFDFQDTYLKVATELLKTHRWKPDRSFATDSLAVNTLGPSGGATVEGLRGVATGWPRFGASAKAFDKLWAAGPPPKYRQPYDPQAFDATVLCYLSAVAAGSTKASRMRTQLREVSAPPGTKYTWQQLSDAIRALEAGKDIDYEGASGPIDIEPLDTDKPGAPTAGFYDTYRYVDARLSLYGSVSVPPSRKGVEQFPVKYITPKVPGATATPPVGASGASGATGAKGAKAKKKAARKKKKGG